MPADHNDRVDEAIAEYLLQCEAGDPPNHTAFLARYPELAESLREFLEDHGRMKRAVDPQADGANPSAPVSTGAETVGFAPRPPTDTAGLTAATDSPERVRYFGDYELLGEIARGGMGVVFKARQVSLNRDVALKMILAGQLSSAADVQRFRIEAEAAANLDHPNILPIYEVGEHQGQQYFSMKLVPGGSLAGKSAELLNDPRAAVAILIQVCRAVHFAHQRGILHRDLKPANILLDSDGTPYVTDFGLAKRVDGEDSGLTRTGAVVGTPSYMAPEQARADRQLTTDADVYSLGAILYDLITGLPPFRAATMFDTIRQVIDKEPEHPRKLNPKADRDLAVIALKCLEKKPARRYESAAALAGDLNRWVSGEPITARPAGNLERAAKWVRRNKTLAGAIASIAAALALGIALTTWQAIVAKREAERAGSAERAADDRAAGEAAARKDANQKADNERTAKLQVLDEKRRTEAQLTRAEKMLYSNRLAAAQRAWEDNQVERAFAELDACRWDYRGWEHNLLYARFTSGYAVLGRHTMAVNDACFSPDGKLAASAGLDAVRVWDTRTGREVYSLKHPDGALTTCFSPDGKWIVTAGLGKVVRIWDAVKGTEVRSIAADQQVNRVRFSPDGTRLAVCGLRSKICIWDTSTWGEVLLLNQPAYSFDFSPDGSRIVIADTGSEARVWDVKTGRELHRIWLKFGARSVTYSPDGTKFATAGGIIQSTLVKVWDANTGQELQSFTGLRQEPRDICFSPDGARLVTVGGTPHAVDEVRVWEVSTGRELLALRGHTDQVNRVQFSPDGTRLITGSDDRTIRVWDAIRGQAVPAMTIDSPYDEGDIGGVATNADGTRIAAGLAGDVVRVWDASSGKEQFGLKVRDRMTRAVSLNRAGTRLATASNWSAYIWNLDTRKQLHELRGHGAAVCAVCFSPDGTKLLTGAGSSGSPGELKVWNAETGQSLGSLAGHPSPVVAICFNQNGTRIATTSEGGRLQGNTVFPTPGEVKVWDAASGKELFTCTGHTGAIGGVGFTPDGKRLVTGGDDSTVRQWDAETGKELSVLRGHSFGVRSVCCSPDGKRIVSGAGNYGGPGEIKVWDAVTGHDLLTLRGHNAWVTGLCFSPDGTRLISGAGGIRRLPEVWTWGTDAGAKPLILSNNGERITGVAFSPDGARLVTKSRTGGLRVWDLRTGRPIEDAVPDADPAKPEATSGAGAHAARIYGTSVRIDEHPARPSPLERLFRERLTKWSEPNTDWHTTHARNAERAGQWFAAAFHYRQLAAITRGSDAPLSATHRAKANDFATRHATAQPRDMVLPLRPEANP